MGRKDRIILKYTLKNQKIEVFTGFMAQDRE
jgi:hypothetical protein